MTAFRWGTSGGNGVPVSPYLSPTAYSPANLNRTEIPAFHIFPGSPWTLFFEERTGASATTPTAQGGLVGTIFDTLTGRYAVAPSDAARATLSATGVQQKLVFGGNDTYSSAIDMSGSDEIVVVAGVEKRGTEGGAGNIIVEYNVGVAGNFAVFAPSSTVQYFFRSGGTTGAIADVVNEAFESPHYAVLTGQGKISTPSSELRINGEQVGLNTATQGTGNFGNSTLYIGSRTANQLFFVGDVYGLIVRAASFASTGQRDDAEELIRSNTPQVFF